MGGEVLIPILADLGTDHRCFKIAASLKAKGYRPVILCDRPLNPLGKAWDGLDVRILTGASHYHGFLPAFLIFLIRLTPILLSTRSRFWIVEDVPPLFLAALLGRLRGVKVVYDAREIILETPMVKDRPLRRLLWGLWHDGGMAMVDTLYAVSPSALSYLRMRYPRKRILLLPNVPRASTPAERNRPDGSPTPGTGTRMPPTRGSGTRLIYQGALRPGSGLQETLRALARAPRFSLSIYGFGPEEGELRALADSLGLAGRVRLHGVVPFESLPRLIAEAHIGLHLLRPTCLSFDLTLSNKVFDYMHGETPMLLGPTSAHRDLVEGNRVGVVAASLGEADILAGLETLEQDWDRFQTACRAAQAEWSWETFEGNLLAPLKS